MIRNLEVPADGLATSPRSWFSAAAVLRLAAGLAVLPLLAGCMVSRPVAQADEPRQPAVACAALTNVTVPASRIGLPTSGAVVTSAVEVAQAGAGARTVPAHCLVQGKIAPVDPAAPFIEFKVALPVAWNSKVLMFGGGGMDGSVPNVVGNVSAGPVDQPSPIARGYATFGSDSGHQGGALGGLDGSFGRNDESLQNWAAADAVKKTHDAALFLVRSHYGRAPRYAYFAGGSTGGREALTAIQRWAADWDGAVAWYPARAGMGAILGGHRMNRALAAPGAYPNEVKRALLFKASLQACDGLDGVQDGLISHQAACNQLFDPSTALIDGRPLRCPDGRDDGDQCLSDAQITAFKVINTPTQLKYLASGEWVHPGYNIWGADSGMAGPTGPVHDRVVSIALGKTQPRLPMPRDAPYISVFTDQWLKYHVTRDPNFDSLALDPENPGQWTARISDLSKMLDAKTDLSAFKRRGGKLLLAHGVNDVLVSARSTEDYYNALVRQFGQRGAEQFVRYYEVPGYNHAGSTVFNATWDSLTALENWVEKGVAPKDQITTDTVGIPGRTRPLCDYPQWQRYRGAGDPNQASSFTCAPETVSFRPQ